jgi:hypothetical protein
MARKLGMRTFAFSALFGSASAVVVLVHHSLNLSW